MNVVFTGMAQIADRRLCDCLTSCDTDAGTLAQTLRPVARDLPMSGWLVRQKWLRQKQKKEYFHVFPMLKCPFRALLEVFCLLK